MNALVLQQKIFEQIKERSSNKTAFAAELSQLLGLGTSAVYKRTRGDILLNLEELYLLANHYQISLDQFSLTTSGHTSFYFKALIEKPNTFQEYLQSINADIELLGQSQNPLMYYVSNDLPIFYYFLSPELLAFKLFIWARTIWEWSGFQKKKFDIQQMFRKYPLLKQEQVSWTAFQTIPSIEFWQKSILDHLLKQIRYYYHNDVFANKTDAFILCEQLHLLIQRIQEMALTENKSGTKEKQARRKKARKKFKLFQNEINNTNNIVLIQSKDINAVYTTFDSPNFQVSSDPSMLLYSKGWFERIQKRSRLISGSEGNCLHFFNDLRKRIKKTERELKKKQ